MEMNKMIMGVAAGLMALTALNAPAAEAKGKAGIKIHIYPKHHVLKWHKWHVPHHLVSYEDCGYYLWKWKKTGTMFWKSKYFTCKAIY
jgi:hypothetical protein